MDSSIFDFGHNHCCRWECHTKIPNQMPNSVDPDEKALYELYHLDLHCLQMYMFWSVGLKELLRMYTLSGETSFSKQVSLTSKKQSALKDQGPVVQSVVSLTSSLIIILLTVLADLIHNILIFFAEKM